MSLWLRFGIQRHFAGLSGQIDGVVRGLTWCMVQRPTTAALYSHRISISQLPSHVWRASSVDSLFSRKTSSEQALIRRAASLAKIPAKPLRTPRPAVSARLVLDLKLHAYQPSEPFAIVTTRLICGCVFKGRTSADLTQPLAL